MKVTITLEVSKLDVVMQGLMNLPWQVSNAVILDINQQATAQLKGLGQNGSVRTDQPQANDQPA